MHRPTSGGASLREEIHDLTPNRPAQHRPDQDPRLGRGDEITVASLWRTTRRGFWIIALVAAVVVAATVLWLQIRTPVFVTSATVAPAARDLAAAGQLVAELEQFAALATFAQVPERLDQVSTLDRFFELITSVRLAERLQEDHQLLQQVFEEQWDAEDERWRPPQGPVARFKRTLNRLLGGPAWTPPRPVHLARYLASEIAIRRSAGGLFRLELEHRDADLAERILTVLIGTADDMLRRESLRRVNAEVAHLEETLQRDLPADREGALRQVLATHYQTQALLEVDQPFAADVVSPPTADPLPVGIDPLLFLVLAAVVGIILGLFVVFLRDALRRNLG